MSSGEAYGHSETRQKILAATLELIGEQGSALSVKDVAHRAGVSRQAVYLHFGDRTGLLIGLVRHMDETLDLGALIEKILAAPTGADLIRRTMQAHAGFSATIDNVALILEASQYEDDALGAAWRDRMQFRHQTHRAFAQRIADLGELANGLTVDEAGDLFYAATLVGPWRELTRELGWSQQQYVDGMTSLLQRALLR